MILFFRSLQLTLLIVFLLNIKPDFAQTVMGYSGLLTIPTAEILNDRKIAFTIGHLPGSHAVLRSPEFGDYFYFVSIGYLPFLETSLGFVRSEHIRNKWGIGDRVAGFRFRIAKEKARHPAVALGFHDPFGIVGEEWAQHFCATYIVFSKNMFYHQKKIGLHLGYGTDWIKAVQHQFVGLFGGVSIIVGNFGRIVFEYDTKKVNFGIQLQFLKHLRISIAILNFDSLTGGINYHFLL